MIDLKKLQKDVYKNKLNQGFNVTDVAKEFNYLYGEVGEAVEAYLKKKEDLGEELADIVIYVFGLAEILGYDLEDELLTKFEKIKKRHYIQENGVLKRVK
jgi:NTP pyrophosphatase (non-canonical NTP hydrolase)